MPKLSVAVLLTVAVAQPVHLFAEQARPSVMSTAIARAFARAPVRATIAHVANTQQSRMPRSPWVSRHPVLFGALSGAGGGALIGGTVGHPCVEESFCRRAGLMQMGAAAGAGIGALAGLVVSWIR